MPNTSQSALKRAINAVSAKRFHSTDGRAVRPCTQAAVTHRHLGMLRAGSTPDL
jgi:hypothetical protein